MEINDLINELRNVLRGRSNMISKVEIERILNKYDSKKNNGFYESPDLGTPIVEKGFWDLNKVENKQGLIPSLINNYNFRKQFTKEELNELDQLRKKEYMKAMREMAKEDGKERAKKDFKIRASKN